MAGSGARFRPTWLQAVGRGLWLGALAGVVLLAVVALVSVCAAAVGLGTGPSVADWWILVLGPPGVGVLVGLTVGRWVGTDIDDAGIMVVPWGEDRQAWDCVVDLRAERRRSRTVVAVYLDSGVVVRLRAPYDGEFLAADPQFERKLFALAQLWRSHRFGGTVR